MNEPRFMHRADDTPMAEVESFRTGFGFTDDKPCVILQFQFPELPPGQQLMTWQFSLSIAEEMVRQLTEKIAIARQSYPQKS